MPMRLGDLSVGFVHSLADAVRSHGVDPQPLLEQYGLDAARLSEASARLSIPRYMRLGHSAIQLTDNPALGLRMGQLSRLSQVGLAGVTAAQGANGARSRAAPDSLRDALKGSDYRVNRASTKTLKVPGCAFIPSAPTTAYNRFVVDSILARLVAAIVQRQPCPRCGPNASRSSSMSRTTARLMRCWATARSSLAASTINCA